MGRLGVKVKLWLDHLDTVDTNRKCGAAKAAETRQCKLRSDQQPAELSTSASYYCGICGVLFGDSEECVGASNVIHGFMENVSRKLKTVLGVAFVVVVLTILTY